MKAFDPVKLRPAIIALVVLCSACGGGGGGSEAGTSGGNGGAGDGGGASTGAGITGGLVDTGGTLVASAAAVLTPNGGQAAGCALQYNLTDPPAQASGTDPLLAQQWHLQPGAAGGTTNAQAAWAVGRLGQGVRVAVVDDGLETVHADLFPNLVAGASRNYRNSGANPLPCTSDEDHGTAVAGIIAARDGNGLGGAGVAPRAALVGYNALATGTDADIADAMTRGLATNAIVHNSWGNPDNGVLQPAGALWEQAVLEGLRSGRGGRGAVYVYSAGNGGAAGVGDTNSNFDGFVNKLGIIAACAVDRNGRSPSFSERGANLLVCGPGNAITTTNLRSTHRSDFSGTSASAPMVSGVAALVLQANPNLTWRDVRLVLAQSARENDASSASWLPSALPGKRFSHLYGFGTVDAKAAVDLAAGWQTVGGSSTLQSCGPYARTPNRPIPPATSSGSTTLPGATISDTIPVGDCGIQKIEFIEVTFAAADHPYSGDLSITLTSPAGRTSVLAETRNCSKVTATCRSVYRDWRFGSVRHLDEPVAGNWRIDVTDAGFNDNGTFQRWSVRFWGR